MMHEFISTKRVSAVPAVRANLEGMNLTYADGYESWCPLAVFYRDYQSLDEMSFGHALYAMAQGAKVARIGWNGKGMWICQATGGEVHADNLWNVHTQAFARTLEHGVVEVLPYFIMKTADDKILMGWLAPQTDMLATDWQVVL